MLIIGAVLSAFATPFAGQCVFADSVVARLSDRNSDAGLHHECRSSTIGRRRVVHRSVAASETGISVLRRAVRILKAGAVKA
jgi:hypothetical protein